MSVRLSARLQEQVHRLYRRTMSFGRRQRRRRSTPLLMEMLEDRRMLAGDLPPDIVVGRTLSAYSIADVQNNQLKITYTVYNQQAEDVSGILLTTTLQSGVSLVEATQVPDQDGQLLVWNIGTIPAFGRASVDVMVSLTNNTVLTLDDGVGVSGSITTGAVSDSAPAAVLSANPLPAALLAATVDANSLDPFIQEQAAKLDYSEQNIFNYLRDEVGYESYVGSLRGARGTLWSNAGNALDEASLGVALFRASGIPARYAQGTLSDPLAEELIQSMFPASPIVVGCLDPATETRDPENDPKLLDEAREHYWVQYDVGSGVRDLDGTIRGASIEQRFANVAEIFAEVPDVLRHKVTVRLSAEVAGQAGNLFFGGLPTPTTVLEHMFNAVELVGRPLAVTHFVDETALPGPTFVSRNFTYTPYFLETDVAHDSTFGHVIQGQSYQEVRTNFPFGSQYVTGLFLTVTNVSPENAGGREATVVEKTLVDRLGFAARQSGARSAIEFDPNGPPVVTEQDILSLSVTAATQREEQLASRSRELDTIANQLAALAAIPDPLDPTTLAIKNQRVADLYQDGTVQLLSFLGGKFVARSDEFESEISESSLTRSYFTTPRIIAVSNRLALNEDQETGHSRIEIDILGNTTRTYGPAFQSTAANAIAQLGRGLADSIIEGQLLEELQIDDQFAATSAAAIILEALQSADTSFVTIDSSNLTDLESVELSPQARARISRAALDGRIVIVPGRMVDLDNGPTIAWLEINSATNDLIAVGEDGGHQGLVEFAARINSFAINLVSRLGQFAGREILKRGAALGKGDKVATKAVLNTFVALADKIDPLRFGGDNTAVIRVLYSFKVGLFGVLTPILLRFDPPVGPLLVAGTASPEFAQLGSGGNFALDVYHDPLFTVPFGGGQVPTVFRVGLHNPTNLAESFTFDFPSAPLGFAPHTSLSNFTVPAGQTGEFTVCLSPTGSLPAPNTPLALTVRATAVGNSSLTASATETHVVTDIHGVTLTTDRPSLGTTPGTGANVDLTLRSIGNVAETVAFTATLPAGVTIAGLTGTVALTRGGSQTLNLTLTPNANVPLNSTLPVTISATFASGELGVQTIQIPIRVVAPGADAAANAVGLANQSGNFDLANRLSDIATGITNLFQTTDSAVFKAQVLAALDAVAGLVAADYFLGPLVPAPTAARAALVAAVTQTEVRDALTQVGDYLEVLEPQLLAVARHGFTFELDRTAAVIQTNVPTYFQVFMQNVGTQTTTYQLTTTVVGSAVLRYVRNGATITSVTLQPGQVIAGGADGVSLEILSNTSNTLPLAFTATARAAPATQLARTIIGSATFRPGFLRIASVVANPPFTAAGPTVDITARLYNGLNTSQDILASYVVRAPGGAVVFTSPTVPFTLPAQGANLAPLVLAPFNTTGVANGEYIVDVTITDPAGAAIPGGTGSGRVRVGLPVSASLVSTVEILSPGNQSTRSSTQSLTLTGIVPLADPYTLIGQATTSGNSNSLAIIGNLAYIAGSEAVDIVDISNPANPVLVGSFAQGFVPPSGYSIVRDLPGDRIAVLSSISLNATGFDLRVYDVSNPLVPTLVSDTTIDQQFPADFQAVGNTALVSTSAEFFLGNVYVGPLGDLVSVNLAAAGGPTITDRLFNTGTPSTGGPHQFGIELVDSDTAYVASFTTSPALAGRRVGRLLVVDYSDPANLVLTRQVEIPATFKLYDVAISGNTALVVGTDNNDAGGLTTRFNTGHLTLITLDITDRDNPVVVSTEVTTATFPIEDQIRLGFPSVVPVGGGKFAVSYVLVDGEPAILLVDASNPSDIRTAALSVGGAAGSFLDEITVAGGNLYAASADGLLVFDIGDVESIPVTASVQVPAGRAQNFNIAPDRITTAAGVDTLEWDRVLGAGIENQQFTWVQNVPMSPGLFADITFGGTVDFTSQGTPGTITLPGTGVGTLGTFAIDPELRTVRPGETAEFTVTINDPNAGNAIYGLVVKGVPAAWANFPASIQANAQGQATFILQLTPDANANLADYEFVIHGGNGFNAVGYAGGTLRVAGTPVNSPDPESHGVVAELTPAVATAGQGTSAVYTILVSNTGSATDTFGLSVSGLPAGVTAELERTTIEVLPGTSNFRQVLLTLTPAPGTASGDANFSVTVTSNTQTEIADSVAGTLTVLATGVHVDLNPPSGPPGSTFQMTVTNTGQVADTFDLSVAAPTALVAMLGTASVSLGPGQSQVVSIDVGAVDFAVPGSLSLVGVAKSRTNPAVLDAAAGNVAIDGTVGVAAALDPDMRELPEPGPASFLLQVDNIGNLEGAYTATIMSTSGPVTASLVGLDGLPTQTIDIFRLPGLSTGAVLLNANLANFGIGTVTVRVTSLTDGAIMGEATATVLAIDTLNPTVAVNILDGSLNDSNNSSQVTFTFSEVTTDFVVGDVTVLGGTLSAFGGSGTSYTATFTANDGLAGTGTVTVPAGSYTDGAGNLGAAGSDTVTVDTLNPTVAVNILDGSLNDSNNSSQVTFTFSEVTTDFVVGDVTVLGGTLSAFGGSGTSYTATFTADDGLAGTGTVTVLAGSYTDAAGNLGAVGSDTVAIDTGGQCLASPELVRVGENTLIYSCAAPLSIVAFAMSTELGQNTLASGVTLDVLNPEIVAFGAAWVDGTAVVKVNIPETFAGQTINFQAFEFKVAAGHATQVSNLVSVTLGPAPLRIAGSEGDITVGLIAPLPNEMLAAAVARWASTGLTASEFQELLTVSIGIDDLPVGVLALTDGHRIIFDATAAGHGWFVDPTPLDDTEFSVIAETTELASSPGSPSSDRLDLFTVLLHELGHVLGRTDLPNNSAALMSSELSAGVRRLPEGATPQTPQSRVARLLWQNQQNRFDVNRDGFVSPLDALLIVNELNLRGSRLLTEGAESESAMAYSVDVTGDDFVSAIDVLGIVNALNARVAATLSAEGESTDVVPQTANQLVQPLLLGMDNSWNQGQPTRRVSAETVQPAVKPTTSDNRFLGVIHGWSLADETIHRALNSLERLSIANSQDAASESSDDLDDEIRAVAMDVALAWDKAIMSLK